MFLKQELAALRGRMSDRIPAEQQQVLGDHIEQLRNGAIRHEMLKAGDQIPKIILSNAKGDTVDIARLLRKGPVILVFYRGGWCPYCNLQLKAYQGILPEIAAAGATLVAISTERPDNTLSTVEKSALAFEVLSDVEAFIGRAFGLVYEFLDDLQKVYQRWFGLDISAQNGSPGDWFLSVAATYVIDIDGRIISAHADFDYRDRVDPREVAKAVSAIKAGA